MERIVERSVLFDIYGNLLTEHQRKIYSDVVDNDYSLSEIGEEMGISRQGVHDAIKRIDKTLNEYEDKLHIAESYLKNKEIIERLREVTRNIEISDNEKELINELIDELAEGL